MLLRFDPVSHFKSQVFSDALEQEQALSGWQQRFTKIGKGRYRGSIRRLDLDGVSVVAEQSAGQLHVESCPPAGCCVIGLPVRGGVSHINGRRVAPRLIYQADGVSIDNMQDGHVHSIMVVLQTRLLPQLLAAPPSGLMLSDNGPSSAALGEFLLLLLDQYAARPKALDEAARRALSADIVERVSQVLYELMGTHMLSGMRPSHSFDLYRRICALVEQEGGEVASVATLARRLGVPDFIIREAFKEALGVTPRVWLRQRRLAFAHRVLRGAAGAGKTIAEIALDHGFNHYSRFAQYYRQTYGELPSRNRG